MVKDKFRRKDHLSMLTNNKEIIKKHLFKSIAQVTKK